MGEPAGLPVVASKMIRLDSAAASCQPPRCSRATVQPVLGRRQAIPETEIGSQQAAWHHAAALEDEFRLGPQHYGAGLQDRSRDGQAEADAPRVPQASHELAIG